MYSFAQRSDTVVMDEPFYGHYLYHHDIEHPGKKEILNALPLSLKGVLESIDIESGKSPHIFIKNMGHHLLDMDVSFLNNWTNIFLIRDPKQLIASFAQVIQYPTIQDIGLKRQAELFDILKQNSGSTPIVIDSNKVLANPENLLKKLCHKIGIPFDKEMLSWNPGEEIVDVPWAKYWYKNVQSSSGFSKQKTSDRPLPEHCKPLYQEALPYYNRLIANALKN